MAKSKTVTRITGRTCRRVTVNSQFKCYLCTAKMCYSNRGNLKRHMLTWHVPNFSKDVTKKSRNNRYFCTINCTYSSIERSRVVSHIRQVHPGMEAFPPVVQTVITLQKQRTNILATRENDRLRASLRRNKSPKFRVVPGNIQQIMRENVQDFMSGGFWASPRDLKDYLLYSTDRRNETFTRQRRMDRFYNDKSKIKSLSNKTGYFNACNSLSANVVANNSIVPDIPAEGGKNYVLPQRPAYCWNPDGIPEKPDNGRNHDGIPEKPANGRNPDVIPERPANDRNPDVIPERSSECWITGVLLQMPTEDRKKDIIPEKSAHGRNYDAPQKTSVDVRKDAIQDWLDEDLNYLNLHRYPTTRDIAESRPTTCKTYPVDVCTYVTTADDNRVHADQFDFNLLQSDLMLSDSSDTHSTDSLPSQGGGKYSEEQDAAETISDHHRKHSNTVTTLSLSIVGNGYHETFHKHVQTPSCMQTSRCVSDSSEKCTTKNTIRKESMYARKRRKICSTSMGSNKSRETPVFPQNMNCDVMKPLDAQRHEFVRQHSLVGNNEAQFADKHSCIETTIPLHREQINADQEIYSQYNSEKVECWIAQHADVFGDSTLRSCEDIVSTVELESEMMSLNNMTTKCSSSTIAGNTDLKPCQSEYLGSFRDIGSSECLEDGISETSENSSLNEPKAKDTYTVSIRSTASTHVSGSKERPRILLRFKRKRITNNDSHLAKYQQCGSGEVSLMQGASSGEANLLQGAISGEANLLQGAISGEANLLQGASSGEASILQGASSAVEVQITSGETLNTEVGQRNTYLGEHSTSDGEAVSMVNVQKPGVTDDKCDYSQWKDRSNVLNNATAKISVNEKNSRSASQTRIDSNCGRKSETPLICNEHIAVNIDDHSTSRKITDGSRISFEHAKNTKNFTRTSEPSSKGRKEALLNIHNKALSTSDKKVRSARKSIKNVNTTNTRTLNRNSKNKNNPFQTIDRKKNATSGVTIGGARISNNHLKNTRIYTGTSELSRKGKNRSLPKIKCNNNLIGSKNIKCARIPNKDVVKQKRKKYTETSHHVKATQQFKNLAIFKTTMSKSKPIGTAHYVIPKLSGKSARGACPTQLYNSTWCNIQSSVSSECTGSATVREDVDMKQSDGAPVAKPAGSWASSVQTDFFPLVNLNRASSRDDKRACPQVNTQTGSKSNLELPSFAIQPNVLLESNSSRPTASRFNFKSVARSVFTSNKRVVGQGHHSFLVNPVRHAVDGKESDKLRLMCQKDERYFSSGDLQSSPRAADSLNRSAYTRETPPKRRCVTNMPAVQPTSWELSRQSDTSGPDVRSVAKGQSWHQRATRRADVVSPFKDSSWQRDPRVDRAHGVDPCSNLNSITDELSYYVPLATNCQNSALDSSSESSDSCESTRRGARPWRPSSQVLQA